jgi:hypothetical protein
MHLFQWHRKKIAETVAGNQPAWKPQPDFSRAVDDALRLLVYAAETGRNVDDATRTSILHAKAAVGAGWDETVSANLLAALTQLAADLCPVTAESLEASGGSLTRPTITILRWWGLTLVVPIVLFSVLGFVSSSISNAIRADIKSCNDLVVKLRGELGTESAPKAGTADKPFPSSLNEGDVITQLQLYASTIRAIDARSRQLNWFVFNVERDPFADLRWDSKESKQQREASRQSGVAGEHKEQKIEPDCAKTIEAMTDNECKLNAMFQLPVGLPNMPKTLDTLTTTYQGVRSFGQDVLDLVSVSYGAITTCLLPILYALLGTCAYLLRCYEEQLRTLTFMPSSRANWARFLIAGIGGAVVGLFGNFSITDGASISPLAIAFLVGYAVDVFFSFLENLLKSFTKPKNDVAAKAAAAYQKQKAPA